MIIIYFKDPAISLVMKGKFSDEMVKNIGNKLGAEGKGPIFEFQNPDGYRTIVFPDSRIDIAYMMEISEKEWEEMKRKRDATRARSTIVSPPPFPTPVELKMPKKKN